MVDWTLLPDELLDLILQKLSRVVDFLRSSVVCKSWYSVARQNKTKRQAVPMLLVPTPDNKEDKRSLYSVAKNQIYDFQLNIPSNKRLAGSSQGWVVLADKCLTSKGKLNLTLLNPFSGKTIYLPPVALSRDPHLYPENFELLIVLTDMHRLVLYKSSEKSWIYIKDHPKLGMYFADVIFYEDKFYFVDLRMGLGRIDVVESSNNSNIPTDHGCDAGVSSLTPRIELVSKCVYGWLDPELKNTHKNYIVETSSGDLILVQRYLKVLKADSISYQLVTFDFKLHKLQSSSWIPIDSLGDDVLFLGDNHSMSVSALQFPECQRNCIYYSDDQFDPFEYEYDGPDDIGVYDLTNRSTKLCYIPDPENKHMPPPIWILPILQGYQ
ncbi:F-box protein [Quillaja saponaria]|uniref:F-box protein n=1 Tax=Quillaja saponaria TaxID=32244 RepID=A0AAD7PS86_QUISA|nr:F-box protein [Quillaja saponaria]